MTALYIILAIFGVILILLFSRVGVILSYNTEKETDTLGVTVSYLFLRIKLMPNDKKIKLSDYTYKKVQKQKEKAQKKAAKKAAKESEKKALTQNNKNTEIKKDKNSAAKAPEKKKKTNIVKLIFDIRELIFEAIKAFPAKLRLDVARLRLKIGCEDAAKTAVTYGAVTEAVGAFLTLLECSPIKIKRGHSHDIMITPDFLSGKIDADIKIKVSIAPSAVLGIAWRFMIGFVKYKISTLKTK